jgi:cardiolipin synthase
VVRRPAELRRLLPAPDVELSLGNSIELFTDGRSGLESMLDAISSARRRVHLETYILRGDATGRRFVAALAERAATGVEVRVLYDAIGSLGLDPRVFGPLLRAGGDVVAFNPLRRFYPVWAPRRRDHRKILVVDGEIGFTGGLNLGDEYWLGSAVDRRSPTAWRDAHVRITGPAVAMLEAVFLESWFRADGPDRPWIGAGRAPSAEGDEAIAVVPDGPTYHRRRVRDLLAKALRDVSRRAAFVTPYFVPGRILHGALASAAERGVRVDLLLAGYTDHPILRWAARDRLPPLLACGVRVWEFEAAMMHAKCAVFDEARALIGTSNLDRQSLEHSYEVNLLVEGRELPGRLTRMIDDDIALSREVTSDALERRNFFERLRDRLARFLLTRI